MRSGLGWTRLSCTGQETIVIKAFWARTGGRVVCYSYRDVAGEWKEVPGMQRGNLLS